MTCVPGRAVGRAEKPRPILQPAIDLNAPGCDHYLVHVLDPSVAGQLAEDLPRDDFLRIIDTFHQDLLRLTGEIVAAAPRGDVVGFQRAAHSLAGASAAVGAARLEAAARLGMAGAQPPTIALAGQIEAEARSALAALAALTR
jgi:HPt (histidine-containing phosphotransfer) domain-containing protein